MNKFTRPIPPALRRAGITEVVDNVPEGSYVGGFGVDFVRLFRKEIMSKCFTHGEQHGKSATRSIESVSEIATAESAGAGADNGRPARRLRVVRDRQSQPSIRESVDGAGHRAGNS